VLIVDSLVIKGVKFVLTRLAEAVEAEMYDESALREELLAAQMKLELGEIGEEEFAAVEESVLAGLREIAERKKADQRAAAEAAGEAEEAGGERGAARARAAAAGRAARAPQKITIESVEADLGHHDEPPDE
jgi:hypothetical protein